MEENSSKNTLFLRSQHKCHIWKRSLSLIDYTVFFQELKWSYCLLFLSIWLESRGGRGLSLDSSGWGGGRNSSLKTRLHALFTLDIFLTLDVITATLGLTGLRWWVGSRYCNPSGMVNYIISCLQLLALHNLSQEKMSSEKSVQTF